MKQPNAVAKKMSLTEGPITKGLILFSLPILFSNLLQQLYNTADGAIVGIINGKEALSSVVIAGKVVQVLISLFLGISVGAGVIVSQYFGAKDKENLSKTVHTTIILSVIFGAALTVIGYFCSAPILKVMRVNPEHIENALKYLQIYFLGVIFVFVYNIGAGILRAVGDSVTPLIFLAIAALVNIGLDVLFVIVLRWGVAGAAWATVVSQASASLAVLLRLFITKQDYKLSLKKMRIDPRLFKKIITIGLPTGLQNSIISIAHIIMQTFINKCGTNVTDGAAIYSKMDGYIYLPLNSFALALSTFVGQNAGSGKYDRAKKSITKCIIISEITTVTLGLLIFFICKPLAYLLKGTDQTMPYTMLFMYVMVLSYPLLAVNDALAGAIRGAGQAFVPAIILITGMCGLRVAFILIAFQFFQSPLIVFLSYPVSWIFTTTALTIYFFKGNWFKPTISPITDAKEVVD